MRTVVEIILAACWVLVGCMLVSAQRAIMFDSDGNSISNDEFVDIRMANPSSSDATVTKTLEDGTIEFRLQPIPQEGVPAGDFAFTTLDGKRVTSADLKGKVVVLNFWFIGCPACRGQEPKLNTLKQKFANRNDVVFIAATADARSDVRKYLKKERFDYLQAADSIALIDHFSTRTYPRNLVIGRDGTIRYWRSVVHVWDKFESVIRQEMAK